MSRPPGPTCDKLSLFRCQAGMGEEDVIKRPPKDEISCRRHGCASGIPEGWLWSGSFLDVAKILGDPFEFHLLPAHRITHGFHVVRSFAPNDYLFGHMG